MFTTYVYPTYGVQPEEGGEEKGEKGPHAFLLSRNSAIWISNKAEGGKRKKEGRGRRKPGYWATLGVPPSLNPLLDLVVSLISRKKGRKKKEKRRRKDWNTQEPRSHETPSSHPGHLS